MASKKRTGLGRGISSLIPMSGDTRERPVDVFFGANPSASVSDVSESAEATQLAADAGTPEVTGASGTRARTSTTRTSASGAGAKTSGSSTKTSTAETAAAKSTTARSTSAKRATTKKPATATDPAVSVEAADGVASAEAARDEAAVAQQADAPAETVDELLPVLGARLLSVDPQLVVPNAWQPRREFDQEALDELTHSVREFGVLQPIVVRAIPEDHPLAGEAAYELIMGERRLRASKAAGLTEVPAILKETPNDDMLRDALLENLHRSNLNPLEEASAYQQLLDDFGITQEQLAQRIGRSRPQVSNTLRLLRLPIDVQRRVAAGVLSAGHARAILSAGEPAAMAQLAEKIVNEDLSVRAAEAAASRTSNRAGGTEGSSSKQVAGGLTGYLTEVGEQLGDRLNTRVNVTLRRTKGQIVIDFASVADLNRILVELGENTTGGRERD